MIDWIHESHAFSNVFSKWLSSHSFGAISRTCYLDSWEYGKLSSWGLNSDLEFLLPKFLFKGSEEPDPTNHKISFDRFLLMLYNMAYFPTCLWYSISWLIANPEDNKNILPSNIFIWPFKMGSIGQEIEIVLQSFLLKKDTPVENLYECK